MLASIPPQHHRSIDGSELAVDLGQKVRNLVARPRIIRIFPQAKMSSDSASAHRCLAECAAPFALGAGARFLLRPLGANLC